MFGRQGFFADHRNVGREGGRELFFETYLIFWGAMNAQKIEESSAERFRQLPETWVAGG